MTRKVLGIIPAVVTPFNEDGSINVELLDKELEFLANSGANGLSVGGSTGEGPTLHDDELRLILRNARKFMRDDMPLVCGVLRTCTRDAVQSCLVAKAEGADAVMVTPPAYNVLVPDEDGMFDFYKTISEKVQLPIIIYNVVPQNTIQPSLFSRLLDETEWVYGVKQSVGSISAFYAMIRYCGDKGKIFAATDDMLATCFELGAAGSISAILSVFPKECVEMWNLVQAGKTREALEIQDRLYIPWQSIGGSQFPIRMKYAFQIMGRNLGFCRSPIVHLSEEEKAHIKTAIDSIKKPS